MSVLSVDKRKCDFLELFSSERSIDLSLPDNLLERLSRIEFKRLRAVKVNDDNLLERLSCIEFKNLKSVKTANKNKKTRRSKPEPLYKEYLTESDRCEAERLENARLLEIEHYTKYGFPEILDEYDDDEDEDEATVIMRNYPNWVTQDWYYIYDEIISAFFNNSQLTIHWNNLPTAYLYSNESLGFITLELMSDIFEGMTPFLEYLHEQNTIFHRTFPGVEIDFTELTFIYINYLHQRVFSC